MKPAFDAIVAGELYVDMIMSGFDFWPRPGTEAFAQQYHRDIGGGAPITACGMAKLGSRTALLAVAGSDTGDWIVERLRQNGVETSTVRVESNEATAFTVVASSPEDRAFLTYAGANRRFPVALLNAAKAGDLSAARHVHLGFAPDLESAGELLDTIRACGCTVSLDVGWHEDWLKDVRAMALLQKLDIFFPNEVESQAMTGKQDAVEALGVFRAAGIERVALKLGEKGSALLWQGEIMMAAAPSVKPVDTTGAGDCFDAGFLHAWLKGDAPERCLLTGNICGGLSTEGYGGIGAFPSPQRVADEISKGLSCTKLR